MEYPQINKIYKYREFSSRTLSMLANNELYFAVSESFNDPFDCRARKGFEFKDDQDFIDKWTPLEASQQKISLKEAHKYVKKMAESKQSKDEYIEIKSQMFQKLVLQSFGICSFSEVSDDILMWSHYSDSHKGMCIEFNRSTENILCHAGPVEYPDDDIFPYVDYWLGPNEDQLVEVVKIIMTKSKHWKNEKEWRLIKRPEEIDEHYRGHSVTYPDEMISGIIFGLRMNSKEKKTVKNILSGKPIKYYEAKTIKNKFQVEIIEVE